ncbi:MAG: DNA polymerase III subunit delta' [Flavobacteriales bacterium]|nr:DNA polymerase III subunit delta' [Flavobacteriales bacterium]
MRFGDVPGHSQLKDQLIANVNSNKVSHAQLFHGPEGTGGLELALAFSQYILCENKQEFDSCGVCPACLKSAKFVHPDVHFIFPNATTKSVSSKPYSELLLTEWRAFLSERSFPDQNDWVQYMDFGNKQLAINKLDCQSILKSTSLKSFEGNYKIFVIWMPERLHYAAAPKLLKVIEEPPEKTLFLFVAHNKTDMLPTILSRLQMVNITRFSVGELLEFLLAKGIAETDAKRIANSAEGNIRKALELSEKQNTGDNFNSFFNWMRLCFSIHKDDNIVKILDWIDGFSKMGREAQKNFFISAIGILRSCILVNYNTDYSLDSFLPSEQQTLRKFAPFINHANLLEFVDEFENAVTHIERNGNAKIIGLNLSLRFAKIIRLK